MLLGLTGGLENPFCLLLVAPVTIAAAALPARQALMLGVLALIQTLQGSGAGRTITAGARRAVASASAQASARRRASTTRTVCSASSGGPA